MLAKIQIEPLDFFRYFSDLSIDGCCEIPIVLVGESSNYCSNSFSSNSTRYSCQDLDCNTLTQIW